MRAGTLSLHSLAINFPFTTNRCVSDGRTKCRQEKHNKNGTLRSVSVLTSDDTMCSTNISYIAFRLDMLLSFAQILKMRNIHHCELSSHILYINILTLTFTDQLKVMTVLHFYVCFDISHAFATNITSFSARFDISAEAWLRVQVFYKNLR